MPCHDIPRGLEIIQGKTQAGGKIVGGACGDIAHGDLQTCLQKAGNGLVEGAVTAAAGNHIKFAAPCLHDLLRITGAGGHMHRNSVVRTVEYFDHCGKIGRTLALSCVRIHHKEHLFHCASPSVAF